MEGEPDQKPAAAGEDGRPGSEVLLDEWIAPEMADESGLLRAGKILEWMDVVGVLAATRHCRAPVVTASVDGLELLDPVRVGDKVTLTATVGYTSPRSIGVSVSMRHGPPESAAAPKSLTGYMTFVALDGEGRAQRVPRFRPETPAELARFHEGELRREFRKKLLAGELPALEDRSAGSQGNGEKKLFIGDLLAMLPRSLRLPFDLAGPPRPRSRHPSYVHKIEPIRAGKLNFHGTLYGGTLMRWIETSAQLSARAYLRGAPVRLVGLHGLTFIRPVTRHVFVHIRSIVAHTAPDSLTVLIDVLAEDPVAGKQVETLRAFLTYAPIDEARARVWPLECAGEEEVRIFEEIGHRLSLQRTLRSRG